MCPTQNFTALREDIVIMIRFWQMMYSDKKYLEDSTKYDADVVATTPSNASSNEFSKSAEVGRPATGWMNTVPLSASSATLSKRSTKSKQTFVEKGFFKTYIKKRKLILELLSVEIEFLIVWYNPLNRIELQLAGEVHFATWRAKTITDNQYKEYTRLAWDISPVLAVYLPERYVVQKKEK